MVYESGVITQQVSSVVIFIAIFIYLQVHSLSGNHLIWTGSLLTGIGYISWDLIIRSNYEFKRKSLMSNMIDQYTQRQMQGNAWPRVHFSSLLHFWGYPLSSKH